MYLSYACYNPREFRQQSANYLDKIIDTPDYEIGNSDDESNDANILYSLA